MADMMKEEESDKSEDEEDEEEEESESGNNIWTSETIQIIWTNLIEL